MSCRTQIVYHDCYGRRGFTALSRPWNRYQLFLAALAISPLRTALTMLEAPAAGENDLLRVHDAEFVDLIQQLDISGIGRLDGSTPAWQGMYARAERVVGGSLRAADLIASGEADHVFNPAGGQHHAHRDRGGGFCIFNDVVAAVRRLQDHGFDRIAVLDVDGHHGDGTESLLREETVLAISLHQFGERTYPGTGSADDLGWGRGYGFTMYLPLARGTGDEAYLAILSESVQPLLRAYRPQVLIVEYGTDAHIHDPLLRLSLSTRAYAEIAARVHALAHELCHGRLLMVGGGGYDPENVVRCWLLMLAELTGVVAQRVHPEVNSWLSEDAAVLDGAAQEVSLSAAARARSRVFPLHGLRA